MISNSNIDPDFIPACATTDIDFFSYKYNVVKDAQDICSSCPIKRQCLEGALVRFERFGVWGGASYTDLRRALNIDEFGDPLPSKADTPPMRCPACGPYSTKFLYVIDRKRSYTHVGCYNCGLAWKTRKKINKAQTNW